MGVKNDCIQWKDMNLSIAVFIWLGDRWLSRRSALLGRDCGGQEVCVASFVRALEGRSYRRRPGWYGVELNSPPTWTFAYPVHTSTAIKPEPLSSNLK